MKGIGMKNHLFILITCMTTAITAMEHPDHFNSSEPCNNSDKVTQYKFYSQHKDDDTKFYIVKAEELDNSIPTDQVKDCLSYAYQECFEEPIKPRELTFEEYKRLFTAHLNIERDARAAQTLMTWCVYRGGN